MACHTFSSMKRLKRSAAFDSTVFYIRVDSVTFLTTSKMDNDVSDEPASKNWQRFMILWSVTPEFFIGSCIICVFSVICVFCLSRFNHSQRAEGNEPTNGLAAVTDDFRNESKTMKKAPVVAANKLRNRKKPSAVREISTIVLFDYQYCVHYVNLLFFMFI